MSTALSLAIALTILSELPFKQGCKMLNEFGGEYKKYNPFCVIRTIALIIAIISWVIVSFGIAMVGFRCIKDILKNSNYYQSQSDHNEQEMIIYMTRINYNVVSRSKGMFKLSLPEECHLIIVLQQPDDSDEPKYVNQLSFHVFKDGETSYSVCSHSTFAFASRSVNHEVNLPAGDYVIIPHVDREIIVQTEKNQETKQEKDSEIGAKKCKKKYIENLYDDNGADDEKKDNKKKKDEWELQLGLRVY
ncbi:24981_t:CDS:2, partial [Racocetra persica]